nr:hypothetical protein [Stenotrophomonas maltophilia]
MSVATELFDYLADAVRMFGTTHPRLAADESWVDAWVTESFKRNFDYYFLQITSDSSGKSALMASALEK